MADWSDPLLNYFGCRGILIFQFQWRCEWRRIEISHTSS